MDAMALQVPPVQLIPQPLTMEAEAMLKRPPSVDPSVGTRHRIGGAPDLPSYLDWPSCSSGDGPMTFYAQLDGFPALTEFDLADAGLIYVFVCFDCYEAEALVSSR